MGPLARYIYTTQFQARTGHAWHLQRSLGAAKAYLDGCGGDQRLRHACRGLNHFLGDGAKLEGRGRLGRGISCALQSTAWQTSVGAA